MELIKIEKVFYYELGIEKNEENLYLNFVLLLMPCLI